MAFWGRYAGGRWGMAVGVICLMVTLLTAPVRAEDTLDDILARGTLRCGTNPLPGFSQQEADGAWRGFMVDICRAVAAAILEDADRIEIVLVEANTRWDALAKGRTDLNVDGATWTLARDTTRGFDFPGVYLYDGQRVIIRGDLPVHGLVEAEGEAICVVTGTTSESNLDDYLARLGVGMVVKRLASDEGAWTAFLNGRCAMFTSDGIGLALRRALHAPDPSAFRFLPEVISREPLGPVVRSGEHRLFEVVRWVLNVMIAAEESGLTSENIDNKALQPRRTDARVLTGQAEDNGPAMGLTPGWAYRVVKQVGSYGEVFTRNLGVGSPVNLPRGLNALWREGGVMYAPPLD